MRLALERIKICNFKGLRNLEIDFGGKSASISGQNGAGKTTIVDAFTWVLFNQSAKGDAPGSDNFREKPLDENGEVVHYLDTTVELFCTLDGARFDLKRTQTENWVKKRGNVEATFQGNVSTYWINGVETKKQDFDQRIKAIADGEIFRMIGSLSAFNHLEWKKRRAQLLALAGSDVDGTLLARDEYRPIADEIAQRNISPDDLRKVLLDQRKAIGNELKMMPVRIDEAKKSLPEFKPHEVEDAEYIIRDTKADIEKIDERIIEAKAAVGASNRGQILALEQETLSIKRRISDEYDANKRKVQGEADSASDNFRRLSALLGEAKHDLEADTENYTRNEEIRDQLREQYMEVKRKPVEVSEVCPTCGQTLPSTAIEATREKAETQKRERLMEIQRDGKKAAEKVEQYAGYMEQERERISDLEKRVEAAQTAREAAFNAVKEIPAEPDYTGDSRLADVLKQIEELRGEQTSNPDEKVRLLIERKDELVAIVNRNMATLAKRDAGAETEQRIKTYEARQRELGAQLSETEILIGLAEKFVQDRCGALEDSINSHFPTVRWKLFDTQINGGITDACTAMLDCDGAYVPYESANTASQIAADIEIVNALSEHYDIRVPLFVDNAERVNRLPEIDTQTIALSVSTDAELMVKEV